MKNFRICSVDLETTGLNPKTCDIIEFGAVLDDLANPKPLNELPRFHCYFLPHEEGTFRGEPYALSMHPVIFKRIAEREKEENKKYKFTSPMRFGNLFKRFLVDNGYKLEHDKVTITAAGKNFAAFDLRFLEEKTDMLNHVNVRHRIIDPAILYLDGNDTSLPNMNMCKARMGLVGEVAHNAIDDAFDVIQLIRFKLGAIFKGEQ